MLNISTNTLDSARPFRIFVSLLDRWEVGYPLSIALIYDALTIAMRVDQDGAVEDSVKENVGSVFSLARGLAIELIVWKLTG